MMVVCYTTWEPVRLPWLPKKRRRQLIAHNLEILTSSPGRVCSLRFPLKKLLLLMGNLFIGK
jgi:hypothetical protein